MPRYDITCPECRRTWEIQRGINAPNPPCPDCGGAVEQLVSQNTQFVLRGAGWGVDNYSKGTKV